LVRRFTVDLPYKAVLHDLQITARYIVLLCGPAVSNPALAAQGRLPVEWRANEPMRIAVIPRDGTAPARWFETPAFFSWHFCNGFEQGEDVIVDYIWIASIPIAQEQGTGIEGQPRRMHRVRIDMHSGTVSNERVSEIFCEFPRVDDRRCGLPYRYGYAAASTMTKKGEHHGYNCTARFDFATGEVRVHEHGPAANAGEPVCIPKPGKSGEQDVYVMAFVTNPPDATRRDYDSELAIFDGAGFVSGPLARIHIPARVPNGFHANWMEGMRLPA
jgi:carotenoid cleavage dioxygenase